MRVIFFGNSSSTFSNGLFDALSKNKVDVVGVVDVPKDKQGAEYNKGYGLQYVKGDFILCIDHDNILPHRKWLSNMLAPLLINPDVVASEPWRYSYNKEFRFLSCFSDVLLVSYWARDFAPKS